MTSTDQVVADVQREREDARELDALRDLRAQVLRMAQLRRDDGLRSAEWDFIERSAREAVRRG